MQQMNTVYIYYIMQSKSTLFDITDKHCNCFINKSMMQKKKKKKNVFIPIIII